MDNVSTIWYHESIDKVYEALSVNKDGLSGTEATKRREQYGANALPKPAAKNVWLIFLTQFLSPLIYVLIGAAILSVIAGDTGDAIFIAAIILINAFLGTWQEWRAENSAAALKNLVTVKAKIRRDGNVIEADAEEIVPGDVVLLESGVKVPCDMRLAQTQDLQIEEALLTGESQPVTKTTDALPDTDLSIGDQTNMAFTATTVLKGRGWGIAVATALNTEIGRIAGSLNEGKAERPPLLRRMDVFSRKISLAVVVVCILLGFIGWFRGMPIMEIFFLMIAVGVSAIPEGLPVALTVALSIGTRRMAKRNVIVRKLPAVEGLGSCTMIASDKTGTLTMDQQSVKKIVLPDNKVYQVSGEGYDGDGEITEGDGVNGKTGDEQHAGGIPKVDSNGMPAELFAFIQAAVLSNEGVLRKQGDGWEHTGDAMDVALLAMAYKSGKTPEDFKKEVHIDQLVPYESEEKFSGAFYTINNELFFSMKGALEKIANHLSEEHKKAAHEASEAMAADGYRVLAFAYGKVKEKAIDQLPLLQWAGLAGLIDPLRPEAVLAVKECREAGVEVVMVTGDHPATALFIAKELGIAKDKEQVMTGKELSAKAPGENPSTKTLDALLKNKKVFARVAPLQKKQIVESMKRNGHFVAVTGDGANDAPALRSAHIGIAMGSGTDLAKETASIIVTDNNFASITAGVEEGRFTYANLRKIIYLLISTGVAEILLVAIPLTLGLPLPFIAVQLLWLNLVTNGIQEIALAFEKGDPQLMKSPPRKPGENIFDALMLQQVFISAAVMTVIAFAAWYYLIEIMGMEAKHARTDVMMLMVLLQNFHVLNCRSEMESLFRLPISQNYLIVVGVILAQGVHIAAAYIPGLNSTLQLEPVTMNEWLTLLPLALSIVLVMEVFKWFKRRAMAKNSRQ